MLQLDTLQDVQQELKAAYKRWLRGGFGNNSPRNCPVINKRTWNTLQSQWAPNSGSNSFVQSRRTGFVTSSGVIKSVTQSVSGGRGVRDLRAAQGSRSFVFHVRVVD